MPLSWEPHATLSAAVDVVLSETEAVQSSLGTLKVFLHYSHNFTFGVPQRDWNTLQIITLQ